MSPNLSLFVVPLVLLLEMLLVLKNPKSFISLWYSLPARILEKPQGNRGETVERYSKNTAAKP